MSEFQMRKNSPKKHDAFTTMLYNGYYNILVIKTAVFCAKHT